MSRSWLILWGGSLVAACLICAVVQAQAPQTKKAFNVKGTFKGWQGNDMIVEVNGKTALVRPKNAQVKTSYTGVAMADFIAPKMFIKFSCDATKTGDIQGEIKNFTICEPSNLDVPFFGPDGEPAALAGKNSATTKAAKDDVMKAWVVGTVRTVSKNEFTLTVPPPVATVRGKFADDAKALIQVKDVRLAQDGDQVRIDGDEVIVPQAPANKNAPKTPAPTKAAAGPPVPTMFLLGELIEVTSTVPLTKTKPGQK